MWIPQAFVTAGLALMAVMMAVKLVISLVASRRGRASRRHEERSMTALILAVLSAVLLVLGVPIFIVLLTAAVIGVWLTGNPIQAVHSAMFGSLDIFPLLAVPLFIYAGDVMSRGGMARRLIELVLSIFGAVRGSLGIATIAACEVFSVMSGSSVACVAAIGKLTIPALKQNGYGERFSVSLITATGVIDIIIPPSITMIIYGIVAQQSVPQLFLAGFVPGILIGFVLTVYVMCVRPGQAHPDHGAGALARTSGRISRTRSGRCWRRSSSSAASMAACSRRPKPPGSPASTPSSSRCSCTAS